MFCIILHVVTFCVLISFNQVLHFKQRSSFLQLWHYYCLFVEQYPRRFLRKINHHHMIWSQVPFPFVQHYQ